MRVYALSLGVIAAGAAAYFFTMAGSPISADSITKYDSDISPTQTDAATLLRGAYDGFDGPSNERGRSKVVSKTEEVAKVAPLNKFQSGSRKEAVAAGPQILDATRVISETEEFESSNLTDSDSGSSPKIQNVLKPLMGQTENETTVEVEIAVPDLIDGEPPTIPAVLAGIDSTDTLPENVRPGVEEIAEKFLDSVEDASAEGAVEFGNAWRNAQMLSDWEFKSKYGKQLWHAEHIRAHHEAVPY